jgi:hypothetical protein
MTASPTAADSPDCPGDQYLNLSLLEPGDVILTFPPGKPQDVWESMGIAMATGGHYSHAILVLSPTIWFESEDYGVGPSYVLVDRVERNGDDIRLLNCKGHWGKIAVFRHPDTSKIPTDDLARKLAAITDRISFKRYPSYVRIARDLKLLNYLPFRDQLLSLADGKRLTLEINLGFFCSEVVAYAYRELGLPFTKEPCQVTPSDIADPGISGMANINVFCASDRQAAVYVAAFYNSIAQESSRKSFVGGLTALQTLSSAVGYIAEKSVQAAVEEGIPPERLTPAGFPNIFPETLESLSKLSQESIRLITAVGLRSNACPGDPSPLREGVEGLEEVVTHINDSGSTLLRLADTYVEFVKPEFGLQETWKPVLHQMLEHFEGVNDEHIQMAGGLQVAFEAALEKVIEPAVESELIKLNAKLRDLSKALIDLKAMRVICRTKMFDG